MRLLLDVALAAAILGALALVVGRTAFGPTQSLIGAARVMDGDSLEIGSARIRLEDIDAPEYDQMCARNGAEYPCGREARRALTELIGGSSVDCQGWRRDRYDRLLARCLAGGRELNRTMIELGWAVAFGGYQDEEAEARRAGRGLWSGDFERPQVWRHEKGGLVEEERGMLTAVADWLRGIFYGRMMKDAAGRGDPE